MLEEIVFTLEGSQLDTTRTPIERFLYTEAFGLVEAFGYFARASAAAYGETPRACLTRRRVERAKSLLRAADGAHRH